MSEEVVAEILTTHILDLAAQGRRVDGRGPDEYPEDHGRARVRDDRRRERHGSVGPDPRPRRDQARTGQAVPGYPQRGRADDQRRADPSLQSHVRARSPQPGAIEVSRVVDRAIRAAETIDLTRLCVTPGEKTWVCYVDIHMLEHAGNLIDAALLAGISALSNATVPAKRFGVAESDYPLEVLHQPIECTFVRLGDTIMVDPTFEEEHAAQGRLTVATDETGRVVAMQKGLVGAFSPDDVKSVARRAFVHGERLRSLVKGGRT